MPKKTNPQMGTSGVSQKVKAQAPKQGRLQVVRRASLPAAQSSTRSADNGAGMVLSHREYVGALTGGSAGFLLLGVSGATPGYDLNPASPILFPWLSGIARAYEKYRFTKIVFELVPKNPTVLPGAVYMGFDYDYDDSVANSETELMVNRGAVSGDVWTPKTLAVDVQRLSEDMTWRYVEDAGRAGSTGRMVYGGYLMVGISGCTSNVSFDLFVSYTVHLSLPAIQSVVKDVLTGIPAPHTVPINTPSALPTLPDVGDAMKRVSGLDIPGNTLASNGAAYRITSLGNRGTLTLCVRPATAASPPDVFAADTALNAMLLDAAGNVLASNINTVLGYGGAFQSPAEPSEWATNGKRGQALITVGMGVLRKYYPTAAYLAPYLTSFAGRVLSTDTQIYSRFTSF